MYGLGFFHFGHYGRNRSFTVPVPPNPTDNREVTVHQKLCYAVIVWAICRPTHSVCLRFLLFKLFERADGSSVVKLTDRLCYMVKYFN